MRTKHTEEVKRQKQDSVLSKEKHTHPAFGLIGLSHINGDAVLVNSSVRHQHFLALRIYEAECYRDTAKDFWSMSGRLPVCEVWLSHAQLADMLFNTNHGDGIPCTLHYVKGDAGRRPEPPYESPLKRHTDELKAELQDTLKMAEQMAKEAEQLLSSGNIKAADRERLKVLAMKIAQDIRSNLPFLSGQVDKKMEKAAAHVKAEVEGFMDSRLKALGLEHLKQEMPHLIEEKKEEE